MGTAGTGGQQRADRRAAGDRRAARRLRPAAHAPARRGFWIDEGLSVGIADRPLGDIPGVLRQDGSPPLYYLLLHVWLARRGRARRRACTACRCCSPTLCVPVAFWAGWTLFGRRTAWIAALLAAVNPFLTQYAQEGRMYALVTLLGLVSADLLAAGVHDRRRRASAAGPRSASRSRSRRCSTPTTGRCSSARRRAWRGSASPGARAGRSAGGCCAPACSPTAASLLLYAPWLPNALYQAAHTGAPWSNAPSLAALASVPARILGEVAEMAVLLAAGAGVVALLRGRGRARAARSSRCCSIAVLTIVLAWLGSQLSPAWANRYLAAAVAPFVLLAAAGLRARRPARARRPRARRGAVGDRRRAGGEEQRARRRRVDRARRCAPATSSSRPSPSRSPCSTTTCPTACATPRSPGRCPTSA